MQVVHVGGLSPETGEGQVKCKNAEIEIVQESSMNLNTYVQ
jgi:hypothetical protein